MQLDTIKLFCDVAEHRSVSRAAELSSITQSAASQRIMALERELGVQLIDRSTRPLQLTDTGQRYHTGCRKIIDSYRRLEQQIKADGRSNTATVHVAAIYSAGIGLLNQARLTFEQDHPDTRIEIHYAQPDQVHEQVRADRVDFGIVSYPGRWRGVASQHLRDEDMVVVTRTQHPLADAPTIQAHQLDGQTMVAFEPTLPIGRHTTEYLRTHHVTPQINQTFDNIDTARGFVAQSDAFAILPRRTVQQDLDRGTLSAIQLLPPLSRPLGIIHNRQHALSTLAQSFIKDLLKHTPSPEAVPDSSATTATA